MNNQGVFQALHNFQPNGEGEILLTQGDFVVVKPPFSNPNEWWHGTNRNTGHVGYFPGTYVTRVDTVEVAPPRPPRPTAASTGTPLEECEWYWAQTTRETVNESMKDTPDGTFLVRDAMNSPGQYTLTLRKSGQNKLIRIMYHNGMYGFSQPLNFNSVPKLIEYFKQHSLSQYNNSLDITITHPLPRPKLSNDGCDEIKKKVREEQHTLQDLSREFEKIVYEYKQYMAKTEYLKQVMEAQKEIVNWLDAQQVLLQEKIDYCNEESSRMSLNERNIELVSKYDIECDLRKTVEIQQGAALSTARDLDRKMKKQKIKIKESQKRKTNLETQLSALGVSENDISQLAVDESIVDHCNMNEVDGREYDNRSSTSYVSADDVTKMDAEFEMSTWFNEGLKREEYRKVLLGKRDGTFLVRSSFHNPGQFTIDLVADGDIKKVQIVRENGKYGLVSPARFLTLNQLVTYYSQHSLREHNRQLDTFLTYPAFDPRPQR